MHVRERFEAAGGVESPIGHQGVDVRMPMGQFAESPQRGDHARAEVLAPETAAAAWRSWPIDIVFHDIMMSL